MVKGKNIEAFFALVRTGLFPVHGEGFKVNDSLFRDVEWEKIYKKAQEQSVLVRKTISAWRRMKDLCRHAMIFPLDSLRFFFGMIISSFKAVSHGE